MKLEGGERRVLKSLLDLQGDSGDYVEDSRLAAATKMLVQDVRDWLETLEGKGFVERARGTEGFSAYITARGKQALRLTEPPISSPKSAAVVGSGGSSVAAPSGAEESVSPRLASSTPKPSGPIRLFYSYSHKDEELRKELEEHLSLLKRQGYLVGWHDRMIGAGEEWRGQLDRNLEEAQVILLLISPSFLASDYCYDIETKRALERHDRGEARVIPILLRPVDWEGAPFSRLQGLPIDLRPVTTWSNRDEAFRNIAQGLRRVVEVMRGGVR
jgi:DNA-binding MarR family transcriptional regulator